MINLFKLIKFTKLGFVLDIDKEETYPQDRDLSQLYFIVTGANSGLGFETTKRLLQMNANVIIICRNKERMSEAIQDFQKEKGTVFPLEYDLSDLSVVESLTKNILGISRSIECLIHNAGALFDDKKLSPQNFETTFALMTLVPFKLSLALNQNIKKQIFVASGGMYGASQNIEDYNFEKRKFNGVKAYAENKRNQVDLAKLFSEKYPEVQSFSMHPGWVDTPGLRKSLPGFSKIIGPMLRNYYQGCDTTIYLAVENIKTGEGEFWFDRKTAPKQLFKNGKATNSENREKLWELLSRL